MSKQMTDAEYDKIEEDFGADFKPLPIAESYYPTRLEYMAGKALQGLVTGRAEKDLKHAAVRALFCGAKFNNH